MADVARLRRWPPCGPRVTVLISLVMVALASPCVAYAQPTSSPFTPSEELMLTSLEDTMVDTGWVPAGSPVQLRLQAAAANTVSMSFPGRASYEWAADTLSFEGDPDAGTFATNVGVEVHAEVRIDVLGLTWGSDLLGPYNLLINATAAFTPYLLTGSPERPVTISEATSGVMVASVPIVPDLLVASGNLDIDLAFSVDASLTGERIDILPNPEQVEDPGLRTVDAQGATVSVSALDDADAVEATVALHAGLEAVTTVILHPHLVMTVLGTEYDIAGIDVPIELPPISDTVVLPAEDLTWARPAGSGDASGSGSGSDGGADDGGGETAGDGVFDAASTDDGCACAASQPRPPLALLAWIMLPCLCRCRRRP